jgi:hypothetical protein
LFKTPQEGLSPQHVVKIFLILPHHIAGAVLVWEFFNRIHPLRPESGAAPTPCRAPATSVLAPDLTRIGDIVGKSARHRKFEPLTVEVILCTREL